MPPVANGLEDAGQSSHILLNIRHEVLLACVMESRHSDKHLVEGLFLALDREVNDLARAKRIP